MKESFHYDGPLLDILFFENGHALVASQYRTDIAHSVDLTTQTCTCENFTIEKNSNCKHLKFIRAVHRYIKEHNGNTQNRTAT
jgi:hypothetical protein